MCSRRLRTSSARLPERVRIRLPASFPCASYNLAITNRELQNSLRKPQNPILQNLPCCELLALEARKKGKKAKKRNLEERKKESIHSLGRESWQQQQQELWSRQSYWRFCVRGGDNGPLLAWICVEVVVVGILEQIAADW